MSKWRGLSNYVLTAVILLVSVCAVFAQTSDADLRQELNEIKQNQRVMQDSLDEIKELLSKLTTQMPPKKPSLQKPSPPPIDIKGMEFDIGDNPVLGSESARFVMVEFTDYQCPYCSWYTLENFPGIKEQYIDKGKIRYVVIDLPLPIHPDAAKAAEAAHCARDQGKFWEMHKAMMERQDDLKDLYSYARALNLNLGEFVHCLDTGKFRDTVNANIKRSIEIGITGVPSFIIGAIEENDARIVTGISVIRGALPFEIFQEELEAVLKR